MKDKMINSPRIPVYRDAGFELYDASTAESAFRKEVEAEREPDYYIYSRYRNPTVVSAEEEIMKLEHSEWALLTQTGMSAIDTALSVFHNGNETGRWLFFSEIYGGTISFLETVLRRRRGIDIYYFTPERGNYDLAAFERRLDEVKPSVVFIETISNPMLIVSDISSVIQLSGKYNARVIVDNTFATPFLIRPLEHGADIVIHSATKYFSGHGNLTAGVLCGNDQELMRSAIEYRKFVGHMISPDDAYRLQTQIQTFELRFSVQCSNASRVASFLAKDDIIGKVLYPGLNDHLSGAVAEKLFRGRGYGAVVTFDFAGVDNAVKRSRRDAFITNISGKIRLIPTLGDPHTIMLPVESVWGAKYPEPGMIRLSVGFENYNDLEAAIASALYSVRKS